MEYRPLGRTDVKVSVIGLGTMTWGEQNTEAEGHAQLDLALDHGVNLVDTAEMYSVPPREETYGSTERIIGSWLKRTGRRQQIVLATKAAGPSHVRGVAYMRGGTTKHDRHNLTLALEDSLKRLQTDYVDLYQLHWPDRTTNFFGQMEYRHTDGEQSVPIAETLEVLTGFVRSGKIRYIGVSNETPWGVCGFLQAAKEGGLERIVSIQNPYSLLNRTFEIGLSEISIREQVGLLAYSPLAFGHLSGKFLNGARPPQSRVARWTRFSRYNSPYAEPAVAAYVELAKQHGLDPAQMALVYVNSRRFVASTLIGATTMEQLSTNLGSAAVRLSEEVVQGIEAIHRRHPNPCP